MLRFRCLLGVAGMTLSPVHLCHLLLCQHCTCAHFRRPSSLKQNGVYTFVITSGYTDSPVRTQSDQVYPTQWTILGIVSRHIHQDHSIGGRDLVPEGAGPHRANGKRCVHHRKSAMSSEGTTSTGGTMRSRSSSFLWKRLKHCLTQVQRLDGQVVYEKRRLTESA